MLGFQLSPAVTHEEHTKLPLGTISARKSDRVSFLEPMVKYSRDDAHEWTLPAIQLGRVAASGGYGRDSDAVLDNPVSKLNSVSPFRWMGTYSFQKHCYIVPMFKCSGYSYRHHKTRIQELRTCQGQNDFSSPPVVVTAKSRDLLSVEAQHDLATQSVLEMIEAGGLI
eukprot:3142316-Amphidinium_carterae.1